MKCVKCGAEAIIRNGKFGPFWCCPHSTPYDNHGTRAVDLSQKLALATIASGTEVTDLDIAVQIEMASFGFIQNDLDRFVEGSPEYAYMDDDEDHWSNIRPY